MIDSNHFAKADMLIRKPIDEVFEAFINPEITSKFWFTKGSARLMEGVEVNWTWEMYNLTIPVLVKKIEPNKSIMIEWGTGKQQSTVEWNFRSLAPSKTFLTITNYNFQCAGEELISQIRDSTGGFTLVTAGLKAWLEHGVQLGLVGDKFPEEMRE